MASAHRLQPSVLTKEPEAKRMLSYHQHRACRTPEASRHLPQHHRRNLASPFWFHFTDAVWRQEGDYGEAGDQGTDRERWITYRDRLVYQNFIQRSPVCPINTLMTHGFILSRWGAVSKNMDYDGIVREMRCAFAFIRRSLCVVAVDVQLIP